MNMANDKEKVLLVIDFTGANFPSALYAIQQWASYLKASNCFQVTIAIATSKSRNEMLEKKTSIADGVRLMREYCAKLPVVFWDKTIDDAIGKMTSRIAAECQPVYPGFNYGSIVNKGLLTAQACSCRYLIRVDPGTRPPEYDIDTVLSEHIDFLIESATKGKPRVVVSRGYEKRIAVRDFFVIPTQVLQHHQTVARGTGIDVFNQVTGGALWTSPVPGIPAIPFQGSSEGLTLVWASDDGLFQRIPETEGSKRLGRIEIPRFDSVGKPKTSFEYYRGVVGAVYLFAKRDRLDAEQARARVTAFLEELKPLLDAEKCQSHDAEEFRKKYGRDLDWPKDFNLELVAPPPFLEQIEAGWQNYIRLVKDWERICKSLSGDLRELVKME